MQGFRGLGFRVQGLGFRVSGFGFRAQDGNAGLLLMRGSAPVGGLKGLRGPPKDLNPKP